MTCVCIQACGSRYIPDGVDFILFDVLIGDNYQPKEVVEQIAENFWFESDSGRRRRTAGRGRLVRQAEAAQPDCQR